jgi:integrase/recombinase XerD
MPPDSRLWIAPPARVPALKSERPATIQTAGIAPDKRRCLFRKRPRETDQLSEQALVRRNALDMIQEPQGLRLR